MLLTSYLRFYSWHFLLDAVALEALIHCQGWKPAWRSHWAGVGYKRMIRHFEQVQALEPERGGHFQWGAALGAGLIPGVLLLLVPRGSPWAGISFFSSVIMGRPLPAGILIPLPVLCLLHLLLSEIYGLIISFFVSHLTQGKAFLTGGIVGIGLYLVNLAVVSWEFPAWRTNEVAVLFTHVVFGLISGGAYRGLLRRTAVMQAPVHKVS